MTLRELTREQDAASSPYDDPVEIAAMAAHACWRRRDEDAQQLWSRLSPAQQENFRAEQRAALTALGSFGFELRRR